MHELLPVRRYDTFILLGEQSISKPSIQLI